MEAKIIKAFPGVPDGEIYPRQIEVGEVVTGSLAAAALAAGLAVDPAAQTPPGDKPKDARRRSGDGGKP